MSINKSDYQPSNRLRNMADAKLEKFISPKKKLANIPKAITVKINRAIHSIMTRIETGKWEWVDNKKVVKELSRRVSELGTGKSSTTELVEKEGTQAQTNKFTRLEKISTIVTKLFDRTSKKLTPDVKELKEKITSSNLDYKGKIIAEGALAKIKNSKLNYAERVKILERAIGKLDGLIAKAANNEPAKLSLQEQKVELEKKRDQNMPVQVQFAEGVNPAEAKPANAAGASISNAPSAKSSSISRPTIKEQASKLETYTDDNIKSFTDYKAGKIGAGELEVTGEHFAPANLLGSLYQTLFHNHKESHKALAKEHMATAKPGVVDHALEAVPMQAAGYKLEAYAYEDGENGEKVPHAGEVHPTALELSLGKSKDNAVALDRLKNSYVYITNDNRIMLRSGKINSQACADCLVALIKEKVQELREKGVTGDIKIVSEQVNSFEKEGKMIDAQHRQILYMNEQLKNDGVRIVHVNLPSNAMYSYAKTVGATSEASIMKRILPGEVLSRRQNLESWSEVSDWATDKIVSELGDSYDVQAFLVGANNRKELKKDLCNEIESLVIKIHNGEDVKKNKIELEKKRADLKDLLKQDYEALKDLEGWHFQDADKSTLQVVTLMRKVLGAQLEIPGEEMDRGKEGMTMLLLYKQLGVSVSLNCKSGCDRSGFWFALATAMESMGKEVSQERLFDMVMNWDERTAVLNKMAGELNDLPLSDYIGVDDTKPGKSREEWAKRFPKMEIPEHEQAFNDWKKDLRDVAQLRNHVLNNIMTFGLQVTATSTGVMGMKWNKGLGENTIPLNFLPPQVKKGDKYVPIVKYNAAGGVRRIRHAGSLLITKFQDARGT